MRTATRTSQNQSNEKVTKGNNTGVGQGKLCLASACTFGPADYFKSKVNHPIGFAAFIK